MCIARYKCDKDIRPLGDLGVKLFFSVLFLLFLSAPLVAQKYPCLPTDVELNDVANVTNITTKSGETITKKTTVSQTLKKLKARCFRGKLVDRNRRAIRFYFLQGCWGNPPAGYLEILEDQRKEIARLKKTSTVIEKTCNPTGRDPYLISSYPIEQVGLDLPARRSAKQVTVASERSSLKSLLAEWYDTKALFAEIPPSHN